MKDWKNNILQDKKIIIISGVILAFIIFLVFIYLPMRGDMGKIKASLSIAQGQIQEIERIIDKSISLEENIGRLRKRAQELKNKFPDREEASLRVISDSARKLNIELISMTPQPKRECLFDNQAAIKVEDKICRFLFIAIEMKCSYKGLVDYLERLEKDSPVFVAIESLDILNNKVDKDAKLNIRLGLNLYLLS